jgi:adenine phosphoribosyltransferase
MTDVVSVDVKSITTDSVQTLYLDGEKAQQLKDKRVLIVDDVISTGESIRCLQELCNKAGGQVASKAFVLAEGNSALREDIVFLEKLPLFFS